MGLCRASGSRNYQTNIVSTDPIWTANPLNRRPGALPLTRQQIPVISAPQDIYKKQRGVAPD